MTRFAHRLGALFAFGAALSGCSSSNDQGVVFDGAPQGTGGVVTVNPGTGGAPPVSLGTGGGTANPGGGSGPTVFDGGQVPITPTQVTAIKGDSCAGMAVEGETLPAVLELVVDVSSSMNPMAPGTGMSKWVVTRDALISAVVGGNGSAGLGPSLAMGLLFYPNKMVTVRTTAQDVTACVQTSAMVPPAALGDAAGPQRALLRTALQQAQLQSSTPTPRRLSLRLRARNQPSSASRQALHRPHHRWQSDLGARLHEPDRHALGRRSRAPTARPIATWT